MTYREAAKSEPRYWKDLDRWGDKLEATCSIGPYDPALQVLLIRGSLALALSFRTVQSCKRLMDACYCVPWLSITEQIPAGFLPLRLLEEWSGEVPDSIRQEAEEEARTLQSSTEDFQKLINPESKATLEEFQVLWHRRKYLPYWGEDLLQLAISNGFVDLVREAIDDPWYTDESRAKLEKVLIAMTKKQDTE